MPKYDPKKIYDIKLTEIFADEDFNCRGVINPIDVVDLAKDIKVNGLMSPILVQPWEGNRPFRLIAGYRRYAASLLNAAQGGSDAILAVVREGLDEFQARSANLRENIQRQDLNILQEAKAIDHFRRANWSQDSVGRNLQVSKGWVQTRFMLLELPVEIQNEAAAKVITQSDIRKIYGVRHAGEEAQFELLHKIKNARIKGLVRDIRPETVVNPDKKRPRSIQEIEELQDTIIETLGHSLATRVLGWTAGHVSDQDMHASISQAAESNGKHYIVPNFADVETVY